MFCLHAKTVCFNNIAIVIGPIPPGTGVIAEAFSFADSKSTSPHNLPSILCIINLSCGMTNFKLYYRGR